MMARRLPLKTVPLSSGINGEAPPILDYGGMMASMLRVSQQGQGLSFDEVCRAVEALGPITQAIEARAEEVTLSDEQWRTLRDKLAIFQFAVADPVIVEFGMMIRNAPEIGA
jgi:hypothetical protein